jgi:hypothetical protein
MNPGELLAKLPARPVSELLAALAEGAERGDDPAAPRRPTVVLHLRGGRDVAGRIVRLGSDSGRGRTLLLQSGGRSGEADGALYVPLDAVEAVTVQDPSSWADLLSGGALPAPVSSVPAPSRLEILRAAQSLAQTFAKESGAALNLEVAADPALPAESLRALSVLVPDVFAALVEMGSDALGKAALSRVKALRIADGAGPGVRFADGRLEIAAALAKGRDGRFSKAELKSRIAALF